MARSDLDELDLGILHALHLDGRASFTRIGEVLGVSDQTVARRYARLRSDSHVRISARTDASRVGEVSWCVRIRCVPSVALTIGRALARRADTSWVKLASGGTEIMCMVRAASDRDSSALLLEQLPKTPNVTAVTANCLLHVYFGGAQSPVDALTAEQAAALRWPQPPDDGQAVLSGEDRRLLELLAADGRMGFTELAAATGRPHTTLRRRVQELRDCGALYFDVDIDHRALRLPMQTMMWLSVAPDRLVEAGEAMAAHPEAVFVGATTGSSNLYAAVLCPDPAAFYRYLATRVAALPAIQHLETAPVIQTLKAL
ncbi:Lrp/AsnC family transcriptional regulator [Dactylosporangium sp. CS-033363]|uniref:Lrp/AsnC family transcriptional regulator n=1 Tax=Dactylosporangium sp. CS-033363 TaxID=3239935 RepID=UPI003D8B9B00